MPTDYSQYATAAWWSSEQAIKLCAGWVPQGDVLRFHTNAARTAALDVLAAWRSDVPLVTKPAEVVRDGTQLVRPLEFIHWLSAHCAAVGQPDPCPVELARAVAQSAHVGRFES